MRERRQNRVSVRTGERHGGRRKHKSECTGGNRSARFRSGRGVNPFNAKEANGVQAVNGERRLLGLLRRGVAGKMHVGP